MGRDYSWEDQDPEQMQAWHEFQGNDIDEESIDSAAFHNIVAVEEQADDDEFVEKVRSTPEFTEVDEEIVAELGAILGVQELNITCLFKGIGCEPMSLFEISERLSLEPHVAKALFVGAQVRLAKTEKFKKFLG